MSDQFPRLNMKICWRRKMLFVCCHCIDICKFAKSVLVDFMTLLSWTPAWQYQAWKKNYIIGSELKHHHLCILAMKLSPSLSGPESCRKSKPWKSIGVRGLFVKLVTLEESENFSAKLFQLGRPDWSSQNVDPGPALKITMVNQLSKPGCLQLLLAPIQSSAHPL